MGRRASPLELKLSATMFSATDRCCRASLLLLGALVAGAIAHAGIGVGKEFLLPNGSFENGFDAWSSWTSDGQVHLVPSAGPSGGLTTIQCDLTPGVEATLALTLPVAYPNSTPFDTQIFAAEGQKVEFGAWFYMAANCSVGDVFIQVLASDGLATTIIAESEHLHAASDPHGRWLFVRTRPVGATDARIPRGAVDFSVVLHVQAAGTVWLDEVQGGLFEYAEYTLGAPSFEDPTQFAQSWTTTGSVALSDPAAGRDAYYGERYLKLQGSGLAQAAQAILIGDGQASPAPKQVPEACGWFYLEPDVQGLGALGNPSLWVKLSISAWTPGTPLNSAVSMASVKWTPTLADKGTWVFLQTQPKTNQALPFDRTHLRLVVEKSLNGTVRTDFVQTGERYGVNGNPKRHVAANYVGWYRSPLFPGATTNPTSPAALWRNWAWLSPPACDPNYVALDHNPDCATSPSCIRMNLRRDGATSVDATLDSLPLAGTYDSRDPDLLRYHVRLARAIGIDSFVYDHQGHALAALNAAAGTEPINEECFEALLDAAEAPGSDLKIAVMYEPKVHFNGWIPNEPTLAAKKIGIENDLVHLVTTYFRRKSVLKHDGRLVVYIFRNGICDGAGTQCMQDSDWQDVFDQVKLVTGRALCLIADAQPGESSPFNGMSHWKLVTLGMLKYQNFTDFVNHIASWPAPTSEPLQALAEGSNSKSNAWASADDKNRFGVAIAWPGFDDSGVAGWAASNLLGNDGNSLCVRVGADLGGAFYSATLDAALASGSDWIQIATWNDWNEGTQIEPQWNARFVKYANNGWVAPQLILDQTLQRAYETQAAIAMFKGLALGVGLDPAAIEACAADYVRTAGVTYD